MKKSNRIFKLFRYASIAMSLLSCFTTYQGFHNTVFASESEAIALLASIAVQTVLLAGVLKVFPVINFLWKNVKKEFSIKDYEQSNLKQKLKGFFKKIPNGVFKLFSLIIIIVIILCSLAISITFSYVSIVNNMYKNDFAVNANIELESFMRNTIKQIEQDTDNYINNLRKNVVDELKNNGENIIIQSIEKNAEEYAVSIPKVTPIPPKDYLIDLGEQNQGINKTNRAIKLWGNKTAEITLVNETYVKKVYSHIHPKKNKGAFIYGIKRKINALNDSKFILYCEYYHQYRYILNKYNQWHKKMQKNKYIPIKKVKGLKKSCDTLSKSIQELISDIKGENTTHAPGTTQRLIDEANGNIQPLYEGVEDLKKKINDLKIQVYGKTMPIEEIISAFGSTDTKIKKLKKAQKQMLKMQGIIVQNDSSEISKISNLMEDLDKYVYTVKYSKKIEQMKKIINKNYNVDNSFVNKKKETQTATNQSITVNEKKWTKVRKKHFTKFTALIYDNPSYLYSSDEDEGNNTEQNYQSTYETLKDTADIYRKKYLDTSDFEKAIDFLLYREYFPYRTKAYISIIIALFLDIGAFGIGYLMYYIQKHSSYKIKSKRNNTVLFLSNKF